MYPLKRFSLLFLLVLTVFAASSCSSVSDKIMYPLEYKTEIVGYGEKYSIPPEIVCAVIRTESGFDVYAESSAGALGLMQILPSTGEEIALRLGENFDAEALKEPETNIKYGCFYLSYLYRNLGCNWDTACAAYNAGIGRVKSWLDDSTYSDDGISLKSIPIKETDNYVKKINKYSKKYKEIYFSDGGKYSDDEQ